MRRHWITLTLVLALASGIAAAVNSYDDVGRPFGGFIVNRINTAWMVSAATPSWWPAISQGQLQYKDIVVSLEGHPYTFDSRRRYESALSRGTFDLSILRGTTQIELKLPVRRFTVGNYLDVKLPDILNGLGFWLLAVAVYRVRPGDPVNRLFAITASCIAASVWLATSTFPQATPATRILAFVWALFASFLGVLITHLATLFPQPVRVPSPRLFILPYSLMAVVGLGYELALILGWAGETGISVWLGTLSNDIIIWAFGLGACIYICRLLYLEIRPDISKRIRRQSSLLLLGVLMALPYMGMIVLQSTAEVTGGYYWKDLDFRHLALAAPLAFAFGILRYQTFQSTHRIVMAAFIVASSALLASVGTWFMRLIEPDWVNSLNWSPFAPLFLVAFLSGTFWSLQSSWRGAFRRMFNWEARSYNAVRLFGHDLAAQTTIAQALVDRLGLERSALWIWDEDAREFRLAARAGDWQTTVTPSLRPDFSTSFISPLRMSPFTDSLPPWLEPLRNTSLEVIAPLVVLGNPIGLFALGKRWDDEIFDQRDLEIVELIAQQSALFLITAKHIEQLRRVPARIVAAQEQQQFKLAQELHDSVQQFLGRLPFYLEASRAKTLTDPDEADAILKRCIADVENAAHAVRQIRQTLAPLQLEQTLTQPLNLLIERFRDRTQIETQTTIAPNLDLILSPEARHALYRIIQQALDNITAHAGASQVGISLSAEEGRINFAITDDGIGITEDQREQARRHGSFGLISMQARVVSLGGEFSIQAASGAGTVVSGWLPVASG